MMLATGTPWSGYAGPPKRTNSAPESSSQTPGTDSDILIALIGPVGSGKSAFLGQIIGAADMGVRHELCAGAHTKDIVAIKYKISGSTSNVVLVDTPGFGDTDLTEAQILQKMSKWLHQIYKKKVFFSAILCFQPISDNRIRWSSWSKPQVLRDLSGNDVKAPIVLVTTMWDLVDERLGIERLAILKDTLKPKIGQGFRTFCYRNTRASGEEILRAVIDWSTKSGPLIKKSSTFFSSGRITGAINKMKNNDDGSDVDSVYTADGSEPREDVKPDPL